MALTITPYNTTVKRFANNEVDLAAIYVMLLSDSATFNGADADVDTVAGALSGDPAERPNEVYGNGWTQGGELLENAAVTVFDTDDAKFDADDIAKTASGGSIGPAHKAVMYDDDGEGGLTPLFFIDFDGSRESGDTTDFVMRWHADGIIKWVYPAP